MTAVFLTFFRLGLTSFGGPVAHIGYFRREFVDRQGWLDERHFAHIVAFCSVLPGPTSSQVGMIVGLLRAGPAGAFAAWFGFTLPSAVALTIIGTLIVTLEGAGAGIVPPWLAGLLGGLGAAATAIVAQAVLGMAKTQCPDRATRTIGAGAAGLTLTLAWAPAWQWVPIAAGALTGAFFCRTSASSPERADDASPPIALPRWMSVGAGTLFVALVVASALDSRRSPAGFLVATIVRAGSLVFGGGHVVLPLLQAVVPAGLISGSNFYAGYGAAQAMPGPLFTFAAFLGSANASTLHGALGASVATVLIFLPSFALIFAVIPVFEAVRANRAAAASLRGANAGVVGLLGALLYSPLILELGSSVWRAVIALGAFTLVGVWQRPPWVAVGLAGVAGACAGAAGLFV
jgi:chromate transporter